MSSFPGTGKTLEQPFTFTAALSKLDEFDVLGSEHLERCLNEPVLQTLDRMIDCDVLVASRSSLSACAAYLKSECGLTIYHPFWHQMLTPEDGHCSCEDPSLDHHIGAFVGRFRDGHPGARRAP